MIIIKLPWTKLEHTIKGLSSNDLGVIKTALLLLARGRVRSGWRSQGPSNLLFTRKETKLQSTLLLDDNYVFNCNMDVSDNNLNSLWLSSTLR